MNYHESAETSIAGVYDQVEKAATLAVARSAGDPRDYSLDYAAWESSVSPLSQRLRALGNAEDDSADLYLSAVAASRRLGQMLIAGEKLLAAIVECEANGGSKVDQVRWEGGVVGIVEVERDPSRIPYRVAKPLGRLVVGQILVRHGSHIDAPTKTEREELELEGRQARGEV